MANWSDLVADVRVLVLGKLILPDAIRFGAVCRSWSLTYKELRKQDLLRPKPDAPWLMIPDDTANDETTARFFSLSEKRTYRIPLPTPTIRRRICYGSSHGWLITADDTSQMHLLNPITGAQIELPPLDTLPFVDAVRDSEGRIIEFTLQEDNESRTRHRFTVLGEDLEEMRSFFFQKAVLSSAPSTSDINSSSAPSGSDFTVMVIHDPGWSLAFARAGDKAWTSLTVHRGFEDVIYHRGQFYAVTCYGKVYVWGLNPNDNNLEPKFVIGPGDDFVPDDLYMSKYLVESLTGKLMMVLRNRSGSYKPSLEFKLLLLNHQHDKETGRVRNKWSYMNGDMGDEVIFLGNNHSMSLSVSKLPELRRNCIYFTDDFFTTLHFYRNETRDIGVYDMGDKTIKQIDALPPHFPWPPPIWLTPNISC